MKETIAITKDSEMYFEFKYFPVSCSRYKKVLFNQIQYGIYSDWFLEQLYSYNGFLTEC